MYGCKILMYFWVKVQFQVCRLCNTSIGNDWSSKQCPLRARARWISQTGEKEENFTINGTAWSSYGSSLIRHWGEGYLSLLTKDHVWLKFFLQVHFGFISFRENFLNTNLGERKIIIILAGSLEVELGRESGGASLWLWNFQQSGKLNDSVVSLVYQKL